MNMANYIWTGNSPLEQSYPVLKAITRVVVDQTLVEYDLIIFWSSALWQPAQIGLIPPTAEPAQAWQPGVGLNAFFHAIDWATDGQAPHLAFVNHASEFAPETLKILVDGLLNHPDKPPLILVRSAPAETPPTGQPDAGLLLTAIKACGVSPSRTLYVGRAEEALGDTRPVLLDYCHPQDLFERPAQWYLPRTTSESALAAALS